MTPQEAQDYLGRFPDGERGGVASDEIYTLDRMRRLLELLEHPDGAYPIVHVVGTKGKGSTATAIAACLHAAGYRTGLYTSPHLLEERERIRLDGVMISPVAVARLVDERLRPAVATLESRGERLPLRFELLTALACLYFRDSGAEAVVLEAGLGGRLDATNAVEQTALTVITTIGYDHMAILGDTLAQIASEKAAVARPGVPVISAPQVEEALSTIERVCAARGAPLQVVGREWILSRLAEEPNGTTFSLQGPGVAYTRLRSALAGAHQVMNAATAVAALNALRPALARLDETTIRAGLSAIRLSGRLQRVGDNPLVLLDAAHNRESAEALAGALARLYPTQWRVLVVGVLRDKDVAAVLAPLLPLADAVMVTAASHPRAMPVVQVAEIARRLGGRGIEEVPSVATALVRARAVAGTNGQVVVTGSLRTVGEAMVALGVTADEG